MTNRNPTPVRDWRPQAACRNANPETFFPAAESGPAYERQVAEAKAVCACCLVQADCLDEALVRIPDGIAGGLTPAERRRLTRGRPARRVVGAELVRLARSAPRSRRPAPCCSRWDGHGRRSRGCAGSAS
jgi:WhiB family redox-sensing transcriptional regulator